MDDGIQQKLTGPHRADNLPLTPEPREAFDGSPARQIEQLRLLAESIPQLVWSCQPDGYCEYLSRQWEEYTGIPAAAQLGLEWLPMVLHPDDQERTMSAWMAAVADRAPYDLDYRIRRHDGVYRWFRARGSPVRRPDGVIERWFGTCTDIDDQVGASLEREALLAEAQKAQEALRRSNDDLRRANEDLNQFAYSASHDLQEPLRMVAIYSQILHRRYQGKLDAEADEYLAFNIEGAQRMQMLVRDLLAYTQVLASANEGTERTDANEVLRSVWSNLAGAVEESGATLHADHLPLLAIKHVHLVQLLQNLIENSIKYRGKEPLVVHVSAERDGSMGTICVRDNGIGIDPKYRDQVFGIFKRLHGPGKYPGTGIGLAICQKIVQRYNGRIWVESEGAERGSTFCFTLPAAADGQD